MEELYDVIVIGGGPAGLTAALYLARARYRVLVLEKEHFGGQIALTDEVVNYPGVERTGGQALTDTMRRQAEAFGAELLLAEAVEIGLDGPVKRVRTGQGSFRCLGLLLATGAHPRTVGFRGEAEHKGRGVAYCATCDGEFFTGKDLYVVGGGYAAAEESVFLTKFARHVTILIRKEDFSCAASVAERARRHEKITVLPHTVLEEVAGERGLTYARYRDTATGEVTEVRAREGESFGVFVFAGYAPDTGLVKDLVACDEQGYLITDGAQRTSVEGIYAAGDVCQKPLRQVVTATGDGALAATELEKYVAAAQERTGLRANRPALRSEGSDPAQPSGPARPPEGDGEAIPPEMRRELESLFARMESPLLLRLHLDGQAVSGELKALMSALAALTDKLTVTEETVEGEGETPWVEVCRADGTPTGLGFHGVPGGHEFTSFLLGLYNAAGPGQPLAPEVKERIAALRGPVEMKVLVTLSCTLCPELVTAAQRIAAQHPQITAQVYDLRHFEALKERYQVMSVPCLVVNDQVAGFGKKSVEQLLGLLSG